MLFLLTQPDSKQLKIYGFSTNQVTSGGGVLSVNFISYKSSFVSSLYQIWGEKKTDTVMIQQEDSPKCLCKVYHLLLNLFDHLNLSVKITNEISVFLH